MTLKILNLYAGIGGNRKLWLGDIKVTAVENSPIIAQIYSDKWTIHYMICRNCLIINILEIFIDHKLYWQTKVVKEK